MSFKLSTQIANYSKAHNYLDARLIVGVGLPYKKHPSKTPYDQAMWRGVSIYFPALL